MKKILSILALMLPSLCALSQKVTFMPQWTPQAQFAGYYVAAEKGFFGQEGLDVTIRHIIASTRRTALSYLLDGSVDIVSNNLVGSLVAASQGADIVNILQTSQSNALCCVCRKSVKSVKDLDGLRIATWKNGFSEVLMLSEKENGIDIDWIKINGGINYFVIGAVDANLAMSYNEFFQILFAMGEIPEENVLRMENTEYNIPEDGLYCRKDYYEKNREVVKKFNRAVRRGWEYAASHEDEALQCVFKYVEQENIKTNMPLQKSMLREILRLQRDSRDGKQSFCFIDKKSFDGLNGRLLLCGMIGRFVEYDSFIKQ